MIFDNGVSVAILKQFFSGLLVINFLHLQLLHFLCNYGSVHHWNPMGVFQLLVIVLRLCARCHNQRWDFNLVGLVSLKTFLLTVRPTLPWTCSLGECYAIRIYFCLALKVRRLVSQKSLSCLSCLGPLHGNFNYFMRNRCLRRWWSCLR